MGATWAGRLAACGVFLVPFAAPGGEPAPAAAPAAAQLSSPAPTEPSEAARALAEAKQRLEQLAKSTDKDAIAAAKAQKADLEERVGLLEAWEESVRAYREAANPKDSPERQALDSKADLERTTAQLAAAAKNPDASLPPVFRKPPEEVSDAGLVEMKDTLEDARTEVRDWNSRVKNIQSKRARSSANPLGTLHAERDKIHQRVAALPARRTERESKLNDAKNDDERMLARERMLTYEWEERVELLRLKAQEAKIALASKRAALDELELRVCEAHVQLADRKLALLQGRYKVVTNLRESRLKQAADSAQKLAAKTDDPLRRFESVWKANLLDLEAQALKHENKLASGEPPSREEQTNLADRAETELANVRKMLDDDLVSQLDALRLNNTFRRIAAQRDKIVNGELTAAARLLTDYDNALSRVELELANDQSDDDYEHQALLERLPPGRQAEAKALFASLDRRHELLLKRNGAALEELASRAGQTHAQIVRRLRILDDEYGLIRTHLFWVRDQEPVGYGTLVRGQRELALAAKAVFRIAGDAADRRLWGRVSVEFLCGSAALVLLVWPLLQSRKTLMRKSGEPRCAGAGQLCRGALVGLGYSAILPGYVGLLAYTARQCPWPRSLALPMSAALAMLVPAALIAGLVRWMLRPGGWAEQTLEVPSDVTRQLRRTVFVLVAAGIPLLLPPWLLTERLIAFEGRPINCNALRQLLGLGFELIILGVVYRLLRGASPLFHWLLQFPDRVGWLNRHRRALCWSALLAMAAVIVLDAFGYSYSARRLAIGAGEGLVVLGVCWGLYRVIIRAIDHHAWRWITVRHGHIAVEAPADACVPDDLANRLRRLTAYAMPIVGLGMAAWIWDVDWALFRFLSQQTLWGTTPETAVGVGDFIKFLLITALTLVSWRHMSTFFAVAVFPRMRDDPGVRFAVLTLCRYAVLGVGLLSGLSTIHLGLEKIGVVLAALGVGLGFGLQEIVSNFVCGIILLLERPIRVGDVVTVSDMTGQVDRINIRATTIINGDNQSMIVPNRAFITSDLVNWTLKDKVIRVTIRLKVAVGTDPDRVAELLVNIAREDADVLRNPLPSSYMEDFSDSALIFVLHAYVPDPSLGARVRHRLFSQTQRRFVEEGIEIPLPTHRLRVFSTNDHSGRPYDTELDFQRVDPASPTPPTPRLATHTPTPAAVESCNRGVDE